MLRLVYGLVILLALCVCVSAQTTPKKGSKLRTTLLETIRVPVAKELKQPVKFRVNRMSVSGNWAFIAGEPLNTKLEHPDYSYTIYAEDVADGLFDNNIFALLKKNSGKWRIVKYLIGCTDVCYLDWYRLYKAPVEIFGIPQLKEEAKTSQLIKPARGSKLRKDLVNALRVPVQKELKQRIIFRISDIRVIGDWAFIGGEPLTPKGRQPDYSKTIHKDDVEDGIFDNNVFGLLKRKGDKWEVVSHLIGCTDVCYLGWVEEYKISKELLPFSQ